MLQDDQAFFRTLFEHASSGMVVVDAEGRLLHCNPAFCSMVGFGRDELAGRSLADVAETAEATRIAFELSLVADGRSIRGEWRFRRKDGSSFVGEALCGYLPGGMIQASVVDVSARVRAEAARTAREKRDRYFLALEKQLRSARTSREAVDVACAEIGRELGAAFAGLGELQPDGQTTIVESAWSAAGELTPFLGRHSHLSAHRLAELLSGGASSLEDALTDPRIAEDAAAQTACRALGLRSAICAPLMRDGAPRALLAVGEAAPRKWTEEEIALVSETLDRVWHSAERARAEEELRIATERFEVALKDSPIIVVSQDVNFRHTWAYNTRVCPSLLIGKTEADFFQRAEDAAASQAIKREAMRTGQRQRVELPLLINDEEFIFDLLAVPLRDSSGKIAGVTCAMMDITARKEAEAALRESEERLRFCLKGAGAAAWQHDFVTGEQVWSPENYALHGRDPKAGPPSYEDWLRCIHPEDRAQVEQAASEAVATKQEYRTQYRVALTSNEFRWIDTFGKIDYAADNSPLRVSGIAIDVTERKRSEEALRESEELLRLSMKSAGAAAWRWDIPADEVIGSAESYGLLGRNPSSGQRPKYSDWLQCVHPEDREKVEKTVFEAIDNPKTEYRAEYRILRPCGEVRWIAVSARVDWGADGAPVCMSGINLDITARKRAEEKLRESDELLRLSLRGARAIPWRWDLKTGQMIGSPETYRLFGRNPEPAAPHTYDDWVACLHPEDRAKTLKNVFDAMKKGEAEYRTEYRIVLPSGEVRWLDLLAHIDYASDGSASWMYGIALDIGERKRAEEALRESDELLRLSMKSAGAAAWRWDIQRDEMTGSPENYELYGLDPAQGAPLRYADWVQRVHPGDRARIERSFLEGLKNPSREYREEYRIVRPSGEVRWLAASAKVDFAGNGSPVRLGGINLDITERKRIEEALRESEERLRFSLRAAGAGAWQWDVLTKELVWSPECYALHGVDPAIARPKYKHWLGSIHPEDRAHIEKTNFEVLLKGVREYSAEYRVLLPSGEIRWLEALGKVHYSADGSALRLSGINLDITARKRAEEALRESEERQRFCLKSAQAGAWQVDIRSRQLIWTPECCEVHGRDPKLGSPTHGEWLQYMHPDDRKRIELEYLDSLIRRVPEFQIEYRVMLRNGDMRWVAGLGKIEYASDGSPVLMSGINIDITERKRAEEALRKAEKEQRQKREELETVLAAIPAPVLIATDACCEVMTGNPAAYDLLQLPAGTNLSKSAPAERGPGNFETYRNGSPLPPADFPIRKATTKKRAVAGEEIELRFLDGRSVSLLGNALPLFDDAGEVRGAVAAFADITELKRTEEALRASEQHLRLALEAAGAGTWQVSLETGELAASDRALAFLGLPPGHSVTHKDALALIHHEDRAKIEGALRRTLDTGDALKVTYRVPTSGGSDRWCESHAERRSVSGRRVIAGLVQDITERKRAEIALRESEELLRAIIEHVPVPILLSREDRKILLVNPALTKLTGYAHSDIPTRDEWEALAYREHAARIKKEVAEHFEKETPADRGAIWVHTKAGDRRLWAIKTAPAGIDASGKRLAVSVALDITERHKSAEEARRTRSKLEAALSAMAEAVLISDKDGSVAHFNEAFAAFHRYKSKQECAARISECHALGDLHLPGGEYVPLSDWPLPRALRGETATNAEYIVKRRDGETYVASCNYAPIRGHHGEVTGSVVTIREITAQKRAENQLRESEARLSSIIDTAADAIIVADEQGTIQSANRSTTSIFGYAPEELVGRHASMLLAPNLRDGLRAYLAGFAKKRADIQEMEALRKNGGTVPLNVAIAAWKDGEGRRFFTGILRDLSERKRQEEALANARRLEAVGQLAGGVAHDFNNLLSVIAGNLELAADRIGDEIAGRLVGRALDAAEKGAVLNRRLLSLASKRALKPQNLNLNDRVEETAKLFASTVGEHIAVSIHLAAGLWMTLADPGEVDSAILNIGANARDAMLDGGRIEISTTNVTLDASTAGTLHVDARPQDYVCLTIADDGAGMTEDVLGKAMEPFFTTKGPGAGTGLGLTSVANFARQSGGFATISSAPGVGCTVRIYLPRSLEEAEGEDRIADSLPLGDGELVLVAEDDDQVREMTLKRIEALGYAVEEARTGTEAIALLESGSPVQIVLSDVVMPGGMTGYELARWVASNKPDIKVIICSGYNEGDRSGGANEPPQNLVTLGKPYSREQLARALRDALAPS
jgi:PAS domain S-box-containing protein